MLIGPCRLQRPRMTTRDETGQGGPGTKGIIREKEPGPGTVQSIQRSSTLFPGKAGEKEQSATPLHPSPPPPLQGSLGRDPLPPSTEHTPSPGKLPSGIDLGENLVSASKSGSEAQFGHKATEWSISGKTASLYEVRQLS